MELDTLTNESFNDLFDHFLSFSENYFHYEFAIELAKEATGFGTLFELLETGEAPEYTGFETDTEELDNDPDFDYTSFLELEATDKYTSDLNDALLTLNLQNVEGFDDFYTDFVHVAKFEGSKEDFVYNLRRSVDFFNFVVDITTKE